MSTKQGIKPLDITSEKELIQEFQGFQDLLSNVTNDWNDRLKALKKIQGYVLGQNRYNETFLNQYLKLTPQINIQLKDLRSAISKEACQLICLSSEQLQTNFEQIAVKYMHKDSLLQTINSGNKVIADNGNLCIQSLIDNVQSEKFINGILEELNSKNKNTRERISSYIIQIMSIYNVSLIDRYSKQFESSIIKGIQDPSQDVRANIREAFCIYKEYFKDKGEKMQQQFDPQTRRALQEQLDNYKHVYENIAVNNKSLEQYLQKKGKQKKQNNNNNLGVSQLRQSAQNKDEFIPNPLKISQNMKLFDNNGQNQLQQSDSNNNNIINRNSTNSTSTQQSGNLSKSTLNNSNGFNKNLYQQNSNNSNQDYQVQNVPGRHSHLPQKNQSQVQNNQRQSKSVKRVNNYQQQQQQDEVQMRYSIKQQNKNSNNNKNDNQENKQKRLKSPSYGLEDQTQQLNLGQKSQSTTNNNNNNNNNNSGNDRKSSLFNLNGGAVSTKNQQLKEEQKMRNSNINYLQKNNNNSQQNKQTYQINLEEEVQKKQQQQQQKVNLIPSNIKKSGQHNYVNYKQESENNNNNDSKKVSSDQNIDKRKQQNNIQSQNKPLNRASTECYENSQNSTDREYENRNSQNNNNKQSQFANQKQQPVNKYIIPKDDDIEEHNDQFQQYEEIEGWNDDEVLYYIDKSDSDNWATRSSSFETLSQILNNYYQVQDEGIIKIQEINNDVLKQLIQTHVNHLSDSHYKVQQSCQNSIILLIQSHSDILFPYVQQILPKVIVNLTINKIQQQSNEIINLLRQVYSCDDLVNPVLKFLEQSHKQPVKICALDVLMNIIQQTENYYNYQNNVRSTVNQISFIIKQHYNVQQIIQPALGIFMVLKDINPQITYHAILSLVDQDQVASIRLLACKYQPLLEEGLKKYLINPNQVGNIQQQQGNQQLQQKPKYKQQIQTKHNNFVNNNINNIQKNIRQSQNNNVQKQQQQQFQQQQMYEQQQQEHLVNEEEISDIDDLQIVIRNFSQNQELISSSINDIIKSLTESFNNYSNKSQTKVLQVLSALFCQDFIYARIVPDSVTNCLNLYTNVPKHIDIFEIDEIIENMLDCVPPIISLKSLIDKIGYEKPPFLQILIKKVSLVVIKSKKQEVSPFLDHLIDLFKQHINEQCPDVRKSVVFCLVDLHFLFESDLDPYLQMFTVNQQKLVAIYIKRKLEGNNGQQQQNNNKQYQQQQQYIQGSPVYDIQSQ